jgi:hypothetical protein
MMLDFRVSQQDGARFFIKLEGLREGLLFALSVNTDILVGPFGVQTVTAREFDIRAVTFDYVINKFGGSKSSGPTGQLKGDDLTWKPDMKGCSAVGEVGVSKFKTKVEVKSDLTIDDSDKDKLRQIVSNIRDYNFDKCGNSPIFLYKWSMLFPKQ